MRNLKEYVPDFTIRDGIWDNSVIIADVHRYRHTAIFPENEEPTKVTFCNNCGDPFVVNDVCANCAYPASAGLEK